MYKDEPFQPYMVRSTLRKGLYHSYYLGWKG